ncbi:hypothetical protein B0A58_15120 [Flavobacterium branchiophilum NBRC 15030 = ATCC 35035]|uniref:DUF7738 domain-containing protein n=1 Tax=Flavobacterium branchiophilum TaxID=55197 RepID=A0A543G2C6_9FLAO|nr:hypothetical protein [Flavobacterium branchiophilum]OXA69817.1 hypothetical protein B0A58_15120 [Flavobacterium branchiophilum NBRC 15030 = ATCC 35035]TQM40228.1 hypothetical protein BC670_1103 [Flavobacterium branchiophilum]GEM55848.1 hypothetical protein FB1_20690 [Flavobacterium branchiophilum NBRC 15030 = ATCC 35035]
MENQKIKNIGYLIILILFNSCNFFSQSKENQEINWEETPFVFDGYKMYYKGKEFIINDVFENYEKTFGKNYRIENGNYSSSSGRVITYDHIGIMMVRKFKHEGFGLTDTISAIKIVFDFDKIELQVEDPIQALNKARPKKFYDKKIIVNGVKINLGKGGMSISEINSKLKRTGNNSPLFENGHPFKSFYYCNNWLNDDPEDQRRVSYIIHWDFDKEIGDELEISRDW